MNRDELKYFSKGELVEAYLALQDRLGRPPKTSRTSEIRYIVMPVERSTVWKRGYASPPFFMFLSIHFESRNELQRSASGSERPVRPL